MNHNLKEILEDFGLTPAESKIYLSLLSLGESKSGDVIEKSQLQSSVVHRVIKQLISKGMVTYVIKGKDKFYNAAEPDTLVDYFDAKRKRLQDILPELNSIRNEKHEKSSAEIFLGKTAIFRSVFQLVSKVKAGDIYYSFSLVEPHQDKEIVSFYKTLNRRRNEKRLIVRVLANIRTREIYEKNYHPSLLKQAAVKYTKFNLPQGLIICSGTVCLLNWSSMPTLVKIVNKDTYLQFKRFFDELYDQEELAYEDVAAGKVIYD